MFGDDMIFNKADNKLQENELMNEKYAELELEHIKLELIGGRFHHLRHFIDSYYCYSNGLVTKGGKAKWSAIMWNNGYISQGAEAVKMEKNKNKLVTRDHAVPVKVIEDKLKKYAELDSKMGNGITNQGIANILKDNMVFVTITWDDDAALNNNKLKQKMPPGYYNFTEEDLFNNSLARYKAAGIIVTKI